MRILNPDWAPHEAADQLQQVFLDIDGAKGGDISPNDGTVIPKERAIYISKWQALVRTGSQILQSLTLEEMQEFTNDTSDFPRKAERLLLNCDNAS
mmetsp:Transcript_7192/g.14394  ORF Transcript_7192/g.14394 Transcript_7192/m.14394 type:complete len:96 (-) Transcript_7192:935-1222(-)